MYSGAGEAEAGAAMLPGGQALGQDAQRRDA